MLLIAIPQALLSQPSTSLDQTARDIVYYFQENDLESLNNYLHPETGIYLIYRIGVPDIYDHAKKLEKYFIPYFEHPYKTPNANQLSPYYLESNDSISYSCEYERWNKRGFFRSTGSDSLLSETMTMMALAYEQQVDPKTLYKAKEIESRSVRIIHTPTGPDGLIFYLTRFGNKWYLTIIDRVTTDCSA